MSLFIYTSDSNLKNLLLNVNSSRRRTDSGFDIPMISERISTDNKKHIFDLNIKIAAIDHNGRNLPVLLLPRSSLANSPFRLSNSIGLIDMGYRGNIKANTDILNESEEFYFQEGTKYFQLCQNNFMPWEKVEIVDIIEQLPRPPDNRGEGGFGSTGH